MALAENKSKIKSSPIALIQWKPLNVAILPGTESFLYYVYYITPVNMGNNSVNVDKPILNTIDLS